MKVIAIAAVGRNGVIGKENGLPWNIPEDMKFFRNATKSQIVVMGRKTFDSLGKPLPNRENAVITRDPKQFLKDFELSGVAVFNDLKDAVESYRLKGSQFPEKDIFIIGGAQIYEASFDLLDEVWLTEIGANFEGDVFFPYYQDGRLLRPEFSKVSSRPKADLESPYQYQFNVYKRVDLFK